MKRAEEATNSLLNADSPSYPTFGYKEKRDEEVTNSLLDADSPSYPTFGYKEKREEEEKRAEEETETALFNVGRY